MHSLGKLMKIFLIMNIFLALVGCDNSRFPASDSITQVKLLGIDVENNERECVDKFETLNCTQEFTPSDFFALECEREEKFAIQCGCHDWICVDKISPAKELSY